MVGWYHDDGCRICEERIKQGSKPITDSTIEYNNNGRALEYVLLQSPFSLFESKLSVLLFSLSVFLCTKIVIKDLLSDSYCLGSYLDKLVIVNKFKAFLKAHSLIGDKS